MNCVHILKKCHNQNTLDTYTKINNSRGNTSNPKKLITNKFFSNIEIGEAFCLFLVDEKFNGSTFLMIQKFNFLYLVKRAFVYIIVQTLCKG